MIDPFRRGQRHLFNGRSILGDTKGAFLPNQTGISPTRVRDGERHQSVPDKNKYNLDFSPEGYWGDAVRMLLANIKGEQRRQDILNKVREGGIEAVPEALIAEKLPDGMRELVGRIHPEFMGGEYLPDSEEAEVEIARVSLKSTTADVISIRATPDWDGIRYRIVDEYDNVIKFTLENSKAPLTLKELIDLIDGAEFDDSGFPPGLTRVFRDSNLDLEAAQTHEEVSQRARELVDFVTVTSVFYPELERWYREEAQEWLQEHTRQSDN